MKTRPNIVPTGEHTALRPLGCCPCEESLGSITVKWQDTFSEKHAEEPFGSSRQSTLLLPLRQDGDAGSNLRLSDGGHEQVVRELIVHPFQDLGVRTLSHQFGHYIGIENKHGCSP